MRAPVFAPASDSPILVAPDAPRLAVTIGPIAAWVCLATYVLSIGFVQGLQHRAFVPLGVTNVVGAIACIVALALMRAGRHTSGTRVILVAAVLDTVLDMFLGPAPFDPAMVFLPNVVVGACLLLGTRDAVITAAIYLVAIPASVPWRAVTAGEVGGTSIGGVIMTELACIGATMLVIVARRAMLELTQQAQTLAARLAVLIERAPDGIVLMEDDGTVRHANPAAERCLAPHPLRAGGAFPSVLLRYDGTPADAPYLRSASDQLLRAYVRDSGRDLAITGARVELPGNGRYVELIVRDVSPRGREGRRGRGSATALAPLRPARRAIVVDDDATVLAIIARQLTRLDWQVTPCASGLEALRQLAAGPDDFDVLLTDVRMPSLDGPELARRVRALLPSLPIILMSGNTAGLTRDLVLPGRPWLFLEKPFEVAQLRDVLESALAAPR
ncbi:MAG: response regulator [Gemmatimonadetes bacterium]|nr:response regulator [Gemmatimonadota bacterium]